MSSVCSDQHKFHPSHRFLSPNKTLREIDVPPRKLLTRRAAAACAGSDLFSDDTMLQKFLPSNSLDDSDEDDPYSADHFRMFEFKVRRCTRSRSHDWTDCPFAHPGEKARRRDPRRYHYSGTVCPEYRRGGCNRGDACEFAHGVFECWLHPARYRTEACKDGKNCKRKVCFFAHTPRQLRILPVTSPSSNDMSCKKNINNLFNHASRSNNNNGCCLFCHCVSSSSSSSSTASPTSTLFNMSHYSPPLSPSSSSSSPPPSPLKPRKGVSVSPISLYGAAHHGVVSYKEAFAEFVNSLEGLSLNEGSPVSGAKPLNLPWIDVSLNCEEQLQQQQRQPLIASSFGCEDQQQFIFSPSSTQTPTNVAFCSNRFTGSNNNNNVVGAESNVPDLAWVNELLM